MVDPDQTISTGSERTPKDERDHLKGKVREQKKSANTNKISEIDPLPLNGSIWKGLTSRRLLSHIFC